MDGNISATGMPDLDLIIGAGGEYRLFNFLTWQAVYSEWKRYGIAN